MSEPLSHPRYPASLSGEHFNPKMWRTVEIMLLEEMLLPPVSDAGAGARSHTQAGPGVVS